MPNPEPTPEDFFGAPGDDHHGASMMSVGYDDPSTGLGNSVGAFVGIGQMTAICDIPNEIQPGVPGGGLFGPDGIVPWGTMPGYKPEKPTTNPGMPRPWIDFDPRLGGGMPSNPIAGGPPIMPNPVPSPIEGTAPPETDPLADLEANIQARIEEHWRHKTGQDIIYAGCMVMTGINEEAAARARDERLQPITTENMTWDEYYSYQRGGGNWRGDDPSYNHQAHRGGYRARDGVMNPIQSSGKPFDFDAARETIAGYRAEAAMWELEAANILRDFWRDTVHILAGELVFGGATKVFKLAGILAKSGKIGIWLARGSKMLKNERGFANFSPAVVTLQRLAKVCRRLWGKNRVPLSGGRFIDLVRNPERSMHFNKILQEFIDNPHIHRKEWYKGKWVDEGWAVTWDEMMEVVRYLQDQGLWRY